MDENHGMRLKHLSHMDHGMRLKFVDAFSNDTAAIHTSGVFCLGSGF